MYFMKKLSILVILLSLSFTNYAQKNIVKINPFSLIFGVGKVTYENVLK